MIGARLPLGERARAFVLGLSVAAMMTVVLALALAPPARAVLVRTPQGQVLGLELRPGINPASIPGSLAAKRPRGFSINGSVDYSGGPVIHTSDPYLIFWDPTATAVHITPRSRTVLETYLTDVATAGANSTDAYGVLRQYTDQSGFADAGQTFVTANQAISDGDAYPSTDLTSCVAPAGGVTNCISDAQIQSELTTLIAGKGLPTGDGANAPIYFVVTPQTVNVCTEPGPACATGGVCGYHSSFTDGASTVLYASIPMLPAGKSCQFDYPGVNPTPFQDPNGDVADNAADNMSHENTETITDPLGTSWFDTNTGNEIGDNCQAYGMSVQPQQGTNPNAYVPTLGGDQTAGTLYDEVINGDHYYTQSEWSNGDFNCEMQPSAAALTSSFTTTSPTTPGTTVTFNPSASTAAGGFTSSTWNFGDGSAASFTTTPPATIEHTYSLPGTYTASLAVVDSHGNLATSTQKIVIAVHPTAAFSSSTLSAPVGSPVAFNAGGSSDPNAGGSINAYRWNFGDGSAAGSGVAPRHAFTSVGPHAVVLTVTASSGLTATVSHAFTALPRAAFRVTTAHPATGRPVSFTGAPSSDPGGAITAYHWNFGDGSTGSGAAPSHTYRHAGTYHVTETVTDRSGLQGTTLILVTVVKASTITKILVQGTHLLVTVSGPGTVHFGSHRYKVTKADTVKIPLHLTAAQDRQLGQGNTVTLTVRLSFVPGAGGTQNRSQRVTVH